jgi:SAM-dependent methyltransferase
MRATLESIIQRFRPKSDPARPGEEHPLIPPESIRNLVGGGDFLAIGNEFFKYFCDLGELKPDHQVLDVGCGVGRMAIPLTTYLTTGTYDGIDIMPAGIDWGMRQFTPRYPNFKFHLIDVYNKSYHPKGRLKAAEYRFPFLNDSFDFVFLTSVFTHMFPRDVAHYLGEIARVLKPNRKCLATFFLMNAESVQLIDAGRSTLPFRHQGDGFRTTNADTPEAAILLPEPWVGSTYEEAGLTILGPIHFGNWCGRERFLSYQDIVVATKAA